MKQLFFTHAQHDNTMNIYNYLERRWQWVVSSTGSGNTNRHRLFGRLSPSQYSSETPLTQTIALPH